MANNGKEIPGNYVTERVTSIIIETNHKNNYALKLHPNKIWSKISVCMCED